MKTICAQCQNARLCKYIKVYEKVNDKVNDILEELKKEELAAEVVKLEVKCQFFTSADCLRTKQDDAEENQFYYGPLPYTIPYDKSIKLVPDTDSNPCEKCPCKPDLFSRTFRVGDSPCDWCVHGRKATCSVVK